VKVSTPRKVVQILFLVLFFYLLFQTVAPKVKYLDNFFFKINPLTTLSSVISTGDFTIIGIEVIILVVLTVFLGRIFCGWVCPLGTFLDICRKILFKKKIKQEGEFAKIKRLKYWILIGLFVCAVFSVNLTGIFDPISILTRVFVGIFFPLICIGIQQICVLFKDTPIESWIFQNTKQFLVEEPLSLGFHSFSVALILIVIVGLEAVRVRFWCRYLCPLGALLGLCSKYRIFSRVVVGDCGDCRLCNNVCKMGAVKWGQDVIQMECLTCGVCQASCKNGFPAYRFLLPSKKTLEVSRFDITRRAFLVSTFCGICSGVLASINYLTRDRRAKILRPPGAQDEGEFLKKCIRCGECIKICSSSGAGLKTSFLECGWQGMWTPIFKFCTGYCEYECNLCGQICPTGAINKMSLAQKKRVVIGRAYIDRSRCIVWSKEQGCIACHEVCPVADAIKLIEKEIIDEEGEPDIISLPVIDEELCVGCGRCQKKCYDIGYCAIKVLSVRGDA
jgi:polyferredoxin/ferredoxin